MINGFENVKFWIFDLDETLYRPETQISKLIEDKMLDFLMLEYGWDKEYAFDLQKKYYHRYGSTLQGLIKSGKINDAKKFESFVHDVDLSHISENKALEEALKKLPGKKYVLTTSQKVYANKILNALGILDCFDLVWGLEETDYIAKPHPHAFQKLIVEAEIEIDKAVMFEDSYKNIVGAKNIGLKTVWIDNGKKAISNGGNPMDVDDNCIDVRSTDIVKTLEELTAN